MIMSFPKRKPPSRKTSHEEEEEELTDIPLFQKKKKERKEEKTCSLLGTCQKATELGLACVSALDHKSRCSKFLIVCLCFCDGVCVTVCLFAERLSFQEDIWKNLCSFIFISYFISSFSSSSSPSFS